MDQQLLNSLQSKTVSSFFSFEYDWENVEN